MYVIWLTASKVCFLAPVAPGFYSVTTTGHQLRTSVKGVFLFCAGFRGNVAIKLAWKGLRSLADGLFSSKAYTDGRSGMCTEIQGCTKTYLPAGGGRGQNPENTAQGHSGHNSICPEGHIASLGTYRIVNRVPAGRILSTGRALGRDLCDKDFVLVRLQQANM